MGALFAIVLLSCSSQSPAPAPSGDAGAAADAAEETGPSCAKVCGGACVSGGDPLTGCNGSSCEPCPTTPHRAASCNEDGVCGISGACEPGFLDCDTARLGCEVDGRTDRTNCGSCGNACPGATSTCVAGKCQ